MKSSKFKMRLRKRKRKNFLNERRKEIRHVDISAD